MTASALENNLSAIEGKVDELLAAFEKQATAVPEAAPAGEADSSQPGTAQNQREESSNSPPK